MPNLVTVIGGDALQPADRDGLAVNAAAAARRFARAVARAPQNPGKNVGLPIEDIRIVEPALRDHPDVLRDVRVGRTGPLAIHDAVVVIRMTDVSWAHLPKDYRGSIANC